MASYQKEARAAVIGASGYSGAELLRLTADHPGLSVVAAYADKTAGMPVSDLYPSLSKTHGSMTYETYDPDDLPDLDVVFLALPPGHAAKIVPDLLGKVSHVIDLGPDFRLKDKHQYESWYDMDHPCPELLGISQLGLPELKRYGIKDASIVSMPGCYVTAASLAMVPFIETGTVNTDVAIVNSASGLTGAGRAPKTSTSFAIVHGDFVAYGLPSHRHTPEIENITGCQVLFVPHLVPMPRGILATCYMRPAHDMTTDEALDILTDFYKNEPFAATTKDPPHTKDTIGSNAFRLSATSDARTGYLVIMCAIDNLVKGAAGGALQCANILLGIPETTNLPLSSVGI